MCRVSWVDYGNVQGRARHAPGYRGSSIGLLDGRVVSLVLKKSELCWMRGANLVVRVEPSNQLSRAKARCLAFLRGQAAHELRTYAKWSVELELEAMHSADHSGWTYMYLGLWRCIGVEVTAESHYVAILKPSDKVTQSEQEHCAQQYLDVSIDGLNAVEK